MGNNNDINASQNNNKFIPSFEFNRSKSSFLFIPSGAGNFMPQHNDNEENASQNNINIDPEKTKSRTYPNNAINKTKENNEDNDTNNFNYLKPPQEYQKFDNTKTIFEIRKIKGGRGRKKHKDKYHNSDEIGNATKKLATAFVKNLNKTGQTLAKKSKNFNKLRFKKLYKPTITKVKKIKNNTKDEIGIFASHKKMRDLFNAKIATVFTDYTFPKRVQGDIKLRSMKNDHKIKVKEELLQSYKKHILTIANKKDNDAFVKFLNYNCLDFLKIFIDYDGKGKIIKEIKLDENIIINSKVFGAKKDAFNNYDEIRKNLIKIIDNESRDR